MSLFKSERLHLFGCSKRPTLGMCLFGVCWSDALLQLDHSWQNSASSACSAAIRRSGWVDRTYKEEYKKGPQKGNEDKNGFEPGLSLSEPLNCQACWPLGKVMVTMGIDGKLCAEDIIASPQVRKRPNSQSHAPNQQLTHPRNQDCRPQS